MERNLAGLNDHLIVCGYGRMGRLVCHEFSQQRLPFVVIDRKAEVLEDFEMPHGIRACRRRYLRRDAETGAASSALAPWSSWLPRTPTTCTSHMSARLLNEKLFIVVRAEDDVAEQKLQRRRESRGVALRHRRLSRGAGRVTARNVVDFIELATRTEHLDLQIEESDRQSRQPARPGPNLARQPIASGISASSSWPSRRTAGHMLFNPPGDALMQAGDTLIALGHRQQLDQLATWADAANRSPQAPFHP